MLKDMFALWQKQSDLMKLQYTYGALVLVTLVAAGLVGLFEPKCRMADSERNRHYSHCLFC